LVYDGHIFSISISNIDKKNRQHHLDIIFFVELIEQNFVTVLKGFVYEHLPDEW
jgi:hypothetical protein